jgi:hypothetical protein
MYESWIEPPEVDMPVCPNCASYDVTYDQHGECDECKTLWSFVPPAYPEPELVLDVKLNGRFWEL